MITKVKTYGPDCLYYDTYLDDSIDIIPPNTLYASKYSDDQDWLVRINSSPMSSEESYGELGFSIIRKVILFFIKQEIK